MIEKKELTINLPATLGFAATLARTSAKSETIIVGDAFITLVVSPK